MRHVKPKPIRNDSVDTYRFRSGILLIVCLLFLATTAARLWYVQATYAEKFESLDCFDNLRTGQIPASRGKIFDSRGRTLADNRTVYTLFVNPQRVEDDLRTALAGQLVDRFGLDPVAVQSALQDTGSTYRPLIREMTRDDVAKFESPEIQVELGELFKEVGIQEREARVYPQGGIAGPVIGFTGKRDDGQVGLWGLENTYDDILTGRPGWYEDLRDQRGMRIPGTRREIAVARDGSDLHVTIDAEIQRIAEEALERGVKNTDSIGGTIVITDPSTGNVLALATNPTFNPSQYLEHLEDQAALFSSATCLSYEAGSVMKIFTFSAALEDGIIDTSTTWDVGMGPIRIGGWPIPDHEYVVPVHSLEYAVVHSSNRAAALTAIEFDADTLMNWFKSFGFGSKTPVNFPGEPCGNLKESFRPLPKIDLADMGFGHGIAVTPLQLAQAVSVFANDGILVPIRLVEKRFDPSTGITLENPSGEPRRVISSGTAEIMLDYMIGVVDEGTATSAKTEWTCAGKTGTAQKVGPDGKYYSNKMYATFAGFGPIPNPRYLIVVILDEPSWPYYGGYRCGPVFRDLFNGLMLRDGEPIPQDREVVTADSPAQNDDDASSDQDDSENEFVISKSPFAEDPDWDAEFGG